MSHRNGSPGLLGVSRSAAYVCQDFQAATDEIDRLTIEISRVGSRRRRLEQSLAQVISLEPTPIHWNGMVYRLDDNGLISGERVVDADSIRMPDDPSSRCDTASDAPDLSEAPC